MGAVRERAAFGWERSPRGCVNPCRVPHVPSGGGPLRPAPRHVPGAATDDVTLSSRTPARRPVRGGGRTPRPPATWWTAPPAHASVSAATRRPTASGRGRSSAREVHQKGSLTPSSWRVRQGRRRSGGVVSSTGGPDRHPRSGVEVAPSAVARVLAWAEAVGRSSRTQRDRVKSRTGARPGGTCPSGTAPGARCALAFAGGFNRLKQWRRDPLRQDRRVLPGSCHTRLTPDVGVTFEDNSSYAQVSPGA